MCGYSVDVAVSCVKRVIMFKYVIRWRMIDTLKMHEWMEIIWYSIVYSVSRSSNLDGPALINTGSIDSSLQYTIQR